MPLLEVRGLEKWYGRRQVVNGVDFDVDRGEVVGLLGPNGAGKTTSFRMTIGLIDADGGKVIFDGRDVTRLPMYLRARAGMGYLAQEKSVFRQLSVEDNLMAILETRKDMTRKQRKDRQDELLDQFGLTKIRKTKANRVSGGEGRRLEIARSLITEPKLIMLDEPFAGIDPKTVAEIQDQIRDLVERYNIGILLDRPPVPRDARGHRPLLPDPRGPGLRLRRSRADPQQPRRPPPLHRRAVRRRPPARSPPAGLALRHRAPSDVDPRPTSDGVHRPSRGSGAVACAVPRVVPAPPSASLPFTSPAPGLRDRGVRGRRRPRSCSAPT